MTSFGNSNGLTAVSNTFQPPSSIEPPSVDEPSTRWTLWTASVAFISVLMCLDHLDIFQSNIGKGLLSATAAGLFVRYMLMSRFRFARPSWPVVLWMILMAYSIPGVMYMKVMPSQGTTPSALLFCAVTMGLLVVSIPFLPKRLMMIHPDTATKVINRIGLCFLIGSFVVLVGFGFQRVPTIRIHERAFLLTIPLTVAFLNRRVVAVAVSLFLMAVVLVLNPRTTIVLSYAVTFALLIYYTSTKTARMVALPITILLLLGFVFNAFEIVKSINASVKTGTTSSDNSSFREEMWSIGKEHFDRSPIYGSLFTHGASYDYGKKLTSEVTGEYTESSFVPLHNDYLEFFVSGGAIGGVLFTGAFVGFIMMGFGNARRCQRIYLFDHMKYNLVLTTTLTNAMICMLVNPVINNAQAGFFVYVLVSLIVMEDFHLKIIGVR